jgi:hypothetical protein
MNHKELYSKLFSITNHHGAKSPLEEVEVAFVQIAFRWEKFNSPNLAPKPLH